MAPIQCAGSAWHPARVSTQKGNLAMDILLQQIINGLVLGSMYALIALGYTMVYGVLRLINFAHGDVYMVGAYGGFYVAMWTGASAAVKAGQSAALWTVALIFVAAMILAAVLGGAPRTAGGHTSAVPGTPR